MLDSLSLFNDKVSALDAYQSKLPEADQSMWFFAIDHNAGAYASILQEIHSIYSQSKNNQLSLLRKIGRIQKFIEVTALRRPYDSLSTSSSVVRLLLSLRLSPPTRPTL